VVRTRRLAGQSLGLRSLSFTQGTDPNLYRLTRRIPDNCDPASSCDYFLGIIVNGGNSSYLDIYLSGDADGWIAIGFSTTASMVCGREGYKRGYYY